MGHWFPRAPAMAPPKMPGAGGGRGRGKGGYKGRMGKRFKKNPDGSDHGNIRNFMKSGWKGVSFPDGLALKAK